MTHHWVCEINLMVVTSILYLNEIIFPQMHHMHIYYFMKLFFFFLNLCVVMLNVLLIVNHIQKH